MPLLGVRKPRGLRAAGSIVWAARLSFLALTLTFGGDRGRFGIYLRPDITGPANVSSFRACFGK